MKNEIKLYNVLFPFWMMMLFPMTWCVVIPANFVIDSLVLIAGMFILKLAEKKQFFKKHILKIYLFGMLSDIAGAGLMLIMMLGFELGHFGDELYMTVPALLLSAALIFVLNYKVSFKDCEKPIRLRMALIFTVATAPYTFLIPSSWLYG